MDELLKDDPKLETGEEQKAETKSEDKPEEKPAELSNEKEEKKEDKPKTTKKKTTRKTTRKSTSKKSTTKKSTSKKSTSTKKNLVDDGPTQHDITEKEVKSMPKKELLNLKEAADFIGVDFKTMRNMASTGNIPLNWSQSMGYVIRVSDLIKIKKQMTANKK